MTMETFFITLFIIVFSIAIGLITYTLYGMLKKMPTSSDDRENLLNQRASNIAVDAAKKALDEVLKQNAELQKKDWDGYKKDLDLTLTPVKESLKELQKNIDEVEKERVEEKGRLDERLTDLISTTDSLSKALSSNTDTGDLGEVIMKNLIERAGMVKYVDYLEQDGTASGQIPDMIINLPDGGKIPVDSKLSLKSFKESQKANDKSMKKELEITHAKNCRTLMNNLAKKEYHKQFNSPIEFVVMFIGSEPAYQTALKHDGKLFLDGSDSKVFVVSPLSLLPLLSLVSEAWKQFQLTSNASKAVSIAKDLKKRLGKFEDHYTEVGTRIEKLTEKFVESTGSYNRMLKPAVRNLSKISQESVDENDLKELSLESLPSIKGED